MSAEISGKAPQRGALRRADKVMSAEEVKAFLSSAYCGRTATVDADGYPYVVPNLFVWMDERIFLHTARYRGHFLANVEFRDRVCFEVDEPGETFPYGPVECDTSIAFRSVVVFGRIRTVADLDTRQRFFTAFMSKYAPPDSWGRPKDSFPRIGSTLLFVITPEIMTGKQAPMPSGKSARTAPP
jgi:uncharacterized protein